MESPGCLWSTAKPFVINTSKSSYVYTIACIFVLIILQILAYERKPQWSLLKWEGIVGGNYTASKYFENGTTDEWLGRSKEHGNFDMLKLKIKDLENKLQNSVTFLPLKDTRFSGSSEQNWFMSTLKGNSEKGNLEYFYFPSDISRGRILCVQGRHPTDGSQNSYGFAWKGQLPINSTLLPGLTFVSENYYDYNNLWHSLTALAGFASWHKENECASPERFVLYHRGELYKTMGSWISSVMHASLGHSVEVDSLEYDGPVCFEKAVVIRSGLGSMSLDKRILLFDMVRCKVRKFCNASSGQRFINGVQVVNLTLLARSGGRSFRNESVVKNVVEEECKKVAGCNFRFVHVANLSFCDQIGLMSMTDILVNVHGAQMTNMIFMEKGGSVMEMFPKGWLESAGGGQYVFHWLEQQMSSTSLKTEVSISQLMALFLRPVLVIEHQILFDAHSI